MYREESDDEVDSGWRFFSGEETEYTSDSANLGLYDVNTIANYDPDIIPVLGAEVGNAYERAHGAQPFRKAADWTQPEDE